MLQRTRHRKGLPVRGQRTKTNARIPKKDQENWLARARQQK